MGLTLIVVASLPIKLWGEAFTTATHLINISPSPVLLNKSPYTLLFHTALKYTQLKTFGCACYPLLRPYNKHKLDFKSACCLFLGYNLQNRGYIYLSPMVRYICLDMLSLMKIFSLTIYLNITSPPPLPCTLNLTAPILILLFFINLLLCMCLVHITTRNCLPLFLILYHLPQCLSHKLKMVLQIHTPWQLAPRLVSSNPKLSCFTPPQLHPSLPPSKKLCLLPHVYKIWLMNIRPFSTIIYGP